MGRVWRARPQGAPSQVIVGLLLSRSFATVAATPRPRTAHCQPARGREVGGRGADAPRQQAAPSQTRRAARWSRGWQRNRNVSCTDEPGGTTAKTSAAPTHATLAAPAHPPRPHTAPAHPPRPHTRQNSTRAPHTHTRRAQRPPLARTPAPHTGGAGPWLRARFRVPPARGVRRGRPAVAPGPALRPPAPRTTGGRRVVAPGPAPRPPALGRVRRDIER